MKKILVLDTFNFLHRAYHALPRTFTDKEGNPINAVYGVASMIITVLDQTRPDYLVAASDAEEPTFRVGDFTGYKAHRKPMEDDLSTQIPKLFDLIKAFGITNLQADGYEADDLIGSIVNKFSNTNQVVIVSNDRDMWQLLNDNVLVMLPSTKGMADWIGTKEARARFGFDPAFIPDYKGLRGDPSDNIPGVFGVGEKSATQLITEFHTIDNIYKNIDKVTPESLRNKLINSYEQAIMSRNLARIELEVPTTLNVSDWKYDGFNKISVLEVLQKYNFKSLIRRLGFEIGEENNKRKSSNETKSSSQIPLF